MENSYQSNEPPIWIRIGVLLGCIGAGALIGEYLQGDSKLGVIEGIISGAIINGYVTKPYFRKRYTETNEK